MSAHPIYTMQRSLRLISLEIIKFNKGLEKARELPQLT
jgi:hypothetical protein